MRRQVLGRTNFAEGLRMRIEKPSMLFRRHAFGSRHRMVALAVGVALSLCGCTEASEGKKPTGVSAEQVCDGALDAEGAGALMRLSGAENFEELSGENDAGEPNKFSLVRAARHLHDRVGVRSSCKIYRAGSGDFPVVAIDFVASEYSLKPSGGQRPETLLFDVGDYAAVSKNGALLYFKCATKGSAGSFIGDTSYVKGEMTSTSLGDRDPRDRMAILNSLARAVAEEVGCAAEANLPVKVPSPSA